MDLNFVYNHPNIPLNCGYVDFDNSPVTSGKVPWSVRAINEMNYAVRHFDYYRSKKFKNVHCSDDAVENFCQFYKDRDKMYLPYTEVFADRYGITKLVLFDDKRTEWGMCCPYKDVERFLKDVYRPYDGEKVLFSDVLHLAKDKYGSDCTAWTDTYWRIAHEMWKIINEFNIVGFIY